MNVLNCGEEEFKNGVVIPLNDWVTTYRELAERKYDIELFTDIHLPVLIKGEWMLIICVPEKMTFKLVVFRDWDWNKDDIKGLLK